MWQDHGEPGLLETLSSWELISKTSALSRSKMKFPRELLLLYKTVFVSVFENHPRQSQDPSNSFL